MSIGAALQWPQYPTAKAADRLVRHGVVVVASAGNEGALGLYGASAPERRRRTSSPSRRSTTRTPTSSRSRSRLTTRRSATSPRRARRPPPTSGSFPDGADRHARRSTADGCDRAALPAASREGRADSPRHLRLLSEGVQRADGRRGRRRACTTTPRASSRRPSAGTPPITIPVVSITRRQRRADRRAARGRRR